MNKVILEMRKWKKRQLEEWYAFLVDVTYFSVKQDGIVMKKVEYLVLGATISGEKETLEIYIEDTESEKY